ncbi:hypothetical protein PR003_g7208 [Phytophthora rubi]|uniref:Uncharacterized protein n=1 Tax=Phytophthora rubi TaxID=129364 RepID=A0A6A4FEK2_9STRA|nr:hypothetical protein PR003_g7208 [Phytophthora rubi]
MAAQWEGVAASLVGSAEFSRANLDGKTAQNCPKPLQPVGRKKMKVSKRASGVEEAYTEKNQLLDDIIAEIDDFQHAKTLDKDVAAVEALVNENTGEVVRQLAVERLKRGTSDGNDKLLDSTTKPNKFAKIAQVLPSTRNKNLRSVVSIGRLSMKIASKRNACAGKKLTVSSRCWSFWRRSRPNQC